MEVPVGKLVKFCGTLYKVEAKRDGSGRLQIDFGRDALESVIQLQRFFADNNVSVAIALVPYKEGVTYKENPDGSLESLYQDQRPENPGEPSSD